MDSCVEGRTSNDLYVFRPFRFNLVTKPLNGPPKGCKSPEPRSGHRLISDGKGNLYCYGGYNPNPTVGDSESEDEAGTDSLPLFREVWKYNTARGRWRKVRAGNIPNELVSCTLFYFKDCLSVFGGTGYPFGAFSSNSVALCDVSDASPNFRSLKVEGDLPSPQYGQGCVLDDTCLYSVGGTDGYDYSCDVHKLDLSTGRWKLLYRCTGKNNEPFGRYRHELAFDGQRIFLLGGGTAQLNANLEQLPMYNLTSNKWDLVKTNPDPRYNYPRPRKYHSCVRVPHRNTYIIIGGYDGNNVLNDCWSLHLDTLTWKFLPSMNLPLATYFHSSAITPSGKLYSYGGVHQASENPPVRISFMFSCWACIPSLKDMSWDAVKHYGFTHKYSKSDLRLLGVPVHFIDEIE